jgi:hypothetical protein
MQVRKWKFRWGGHTLRKDDEQKSKVALQWSPRGNRGKGRARNSWGKSTLREAGRSWSELRCSAADQDKWKKLADDLGSWWNYRLFIIIIIIPNQKFLTSSRPIRCSQWIIRVVVQDEFLFLICIRCTHIRKVPSIPHLNISSPEQVNGSQQNVIIGSYTKCCSARINVVQYWSSIDHASCALKSLNMVNA